jgi:hypothetical protein
MTGPTARQITPTVTPAIRVALAGSSAEYVARRRPDGHYIAVVNGRTLFHEWRERTRKPVSGSWADDVTEAVRKLADIEAELEHPRRDYAAAAE